MSFFDAPQEKDTIQFVVILTFLLATINLTI